MKRDLAGWLEYIEQIHPQTMDMGLDRVRAVAHAMSLLPLNCPAVLVAGTNGKGSTCIALEAVLQAHGLRTGTTLSPHIVHFTERVRVDGASADEGLLCRGFEAVDAARGDTTLTYFEFSTLLALWCFREQRVDVAILEIGLGGRLDAFNIVDADIGIVTSIGLDHQEYLGDDLESIGNEKAGIFRPGQAVVLGADMPASVVHEAERLACEIARYGQAMAVHWAADGRAVAELSDANIPLGHGLAAHNQALALAAARLLVELDADLAEHALAVVDMRGRMQRASIAGREILLDVAHNPAGAAFLQAELKRRAIDPVAVVFGCYKDKDAPEIVAAMPDLATVPWCVIPTTGPRGQAAETLAASLRASTSLEVSCAPDLVAALEQLAPTPRGTSDSEQDPANETILVFGSFAIAEAVHAHLHES